MIIQNPARTIAMPTINANGPNWSPIDVADAAALVSTMPSGSMIVALIVAIVASVRRRVDRRDDQVPEALDDVDALREHRDERSEYRALKQRPKRAAGVQKPDGPGEHRVRGRVGTAREFVGGSRHYDPRRS